MGELKLAPFSDVLAAYSAGQMVVIVDDADRENEGDVSIATQLITPEAISFMLNKARGLICCSIGVEVGRRLDLHFQTLNNCSPFQTPFTVSVDARSVVRYGVTAQGRVETMRQMLSESATPLDFVTPGHVFPLIANPAGVLARRGQTEGSYDLARLSGLKPSGVICEILKPDGTIARGQELTRFAEKHGLLITSIDEIVRYRIQHEVFVRKVAEAELETDYGVWRTYVFEDDVLQREHLALVYGDVSELANTSHDVMIRIHSECLTGDVFGSRRCDCGAQLAEAMRLIREAKRGIVIYLRQEGRGIGLLNKLKAYALQDRGRDTVDANLELGFNADERDYAVAARILEYFGVDSVRILTNNPSKLSELNRCGIRIAQRVPLLVAEDLYAASYIATKREKLGHLL